MAGLLVHEWAERAGGAEKVVDQLVETFPDADLHVLWNDAQERYPQASETWLARTPLRRSKVLALPFMLSTWRNLRRAREYDWMLVSSHLFAHHARVRRQPFLPKLVYAHTPARYIWEPSLDPRGSSAAARFAAAALKPVDRARAAEAASIAANSSFTRERVERAWEREACVIYPPVDTARIVAVGDWRERLGASDADAFSSLPSEYILGASRFVPYKRLHLVIDAGVANGLPVVLAGGGPDEQRLRAYAQDVSVPVTFVPTPSTTFLMALYQNAVAYVFPAVEDFGIMPVEAMATGTPVIVPSTGGAAESTALLRGGSTIEEFTPSAWRNALTAAMRTDRVGLPERTLALSSERFRDEVRRWVAQEGHA